MSCNSGRIPGDRSTGQDRTTQRRIHARNYLRCEAIETAYALKQLVTAGVRVFFYLEDRERTLDSPTDKIMLSLTAFADELEREKARQRVTDAMTRKARAGHVTGGACFGYRNVDVTTPGPDGREHRQFVRREIDPDQAGVIRRIFELCAAGDGLKGITKRLNADSVLAPKSSTGPAAGLGTVQRARDPISRVLPGRAGL